MRHSKQILFIVLISTSLLWFLFDIFPKSNSREGFVAREDAVNKEKIENNIIMEKAPKSLSIGKIDWDKDIFYEAASDAPVKIEDQFSEPPITTLPVSVTMAKIADFILVDPTIDEWAIMDARITITTNSDGNVVALQKGGSDGFTAEELIKCAEMSIKVGSKIREEIIKQTQNGDN